MDEAVITSYPHLEELTLTGNLIHHLTPSHLPTSLKVHMPADIICYQELNKSNAKLSTSQQATSSNAMLPGGLGMRDCWVCGLRRTVTGADHGHCLVVLA